MECRLLSISHDLDTFDLSVWLRVNGQHYNSDSTSIVQTVQECVWITAAHDTTRGTTPTYPFLSHTTQECVRATAAHDATRGTTPMYPLLCHTSDKNVSGLQPPMTQQGAQHQRTPCCVTHLTRMCQGTVAHDTTRVTEPTYPLLRHKPHKNVSWLQSHVTQQGALHQHTLCCATNHTRMCHGYRHT